MEGIKNIIFDLGDVIINISPERCYKAFAELAGYDMQETVEKFNEAQIFELYESGLISDQDFLNLVKETIQKPLTDEKIIWAWQQILLDIPPQRIELIQKLKEKYNLYILSNTSYYHVVEINGILERATGVKKLEDLVIKPYYSFELKLRKPDPVIYTTILDDAGIIAEETLFLDDNKSNIESAKEVGLQTILVEKPTDMTEYIQHA